MRKTDWMSARNIVENWDHLAQVLPVSLRPKSELVRALVRDHDDLRALGAVLKRCTTCASSIARSGKTLGKATRSTRCAAIC